MQLVVNSGNRIFLVLSIAVYFSLLTLNAQDPKGCFIVDFHSKTAVIPPYEDHKQPDFYPTVTLTVDPADTLAKVSKYIYGNNANPYMTQIVTEPDLMANIRRLEPNIIRYPGGNLSSVFFWNSIKNQPPADAPAMIADADGNLVDAGYWYGKNSDSWTLSLDNYYSMLSQTNNTGIITVNYGYARYGTGPEPAITAAHYAADWVRYDNGRTKYWEIGNESGGPWQAGFRINMAANQDGQPEIISGALYGEHFKIFADSMKKAAMETGHTIYIGAQLLQYDASSSYNPPDRTWNQGFFNSAGNKTDFFIVHNYYTPYNENSTPAVILNSGQTETINMMAFLKSNTAANNVEMKPLALTEWNIFAVGSKQACSYINGILATLVLGELIKQQYGQASRWDLANGYANGDDQGIFNNRDEPGVPDWNPRPAFFYMYYFQKFFGDHLLKSTVIGDPDIVCYASSFSSGEIGLVVINKGTHNEMVGINMPDFGYGERYFMYNLTGGTDNGSFSQKVYVNDHQPDNLTGGPINNIDELKAWSDIIAKPVTFFSPGYSVQYVLINHGSYIIDAVEDNEIIKPKIYPNPAKDNITITSSSDIDKVEITSLNGIIVKTQTSPSEDNTIKMNLFLPSGIYLARIYSKGKTSIEKLIVIK
ncbi:MAG: T9SS type A sorting domain-containing protein [Bacteroidales bacterium]